MRTDTVDKEDLILVERVQAGDARSFERLVEKYKKRIYYLAYRMTRDHDSADELAQESFVKAYQAMPSFKRGYSFYTWIYRICVNLSINFLKKERQTVSVDFHGDSGAGYEQQQYSDQLERMIASEQASIAKSALEMIPAEQKAVFILKTYEEMSYEQMAQIMSCSVGTIMSRLHRARTKLRKALQAAELRRIGKEKSDGGLRA